MISGATLSAREALEIVSGMTGVRERPRFLPPMAASAAAALVEGGFRVRAPPPPVCRAMVRTLLHGHRYDGSRAERELGLRYTPVRDTFARTIEWAVRRRPREKRPLPAWPPAEGLTARGPGYSIRYGTQPRTRRSCGAGTAGNEASCGSGAEASGFAEGVDHKPDPPSEESRARLRARHPRGAGEATPSRVGASARASSNCLTTRRRPSSGASARASRRARRASDQLVPRQAAAFAPSNRLTARRGLRAARRARRRR